MSSYPTIKFFPKGTTEPVEYDGARTEDAFVEFLNTHCGTHRTVGGLLDDAVGRGPERLRIHIQQPVELLGVEVGGHATQSTDGATAGATR